MYANYSTTKSMPDVRVNSGVRRRMRVLMFTLLCFMVWASITIWNQSGKVNAKLSKLAVFEHQLAETQKVNEEYKKEVTRLRDPEYIEQRARKDFQMTKDGETLFILPKD